MRLQGFSFKLTPDSLIHLQLTTPLPHQPPTTDHQLLLTSLALTGPPASCTCSTQHCILHTSYLGLGACVCGARVSAFGKRPTASYNARRCRLRFQLQPPAPAETPLLLHVVNLATPCGRNRMPQAPCPRQGRLVEG